MLLLIKCHLKETIRSVRWETPKKVLTNKFGLKHFRNADKSYTWSLIKFLYLNPLLFYSVRNKQTNLKAISGKLLILSYGSSFSLFISHHLLFYLATDSLTTTKILSFLLSKKMKRIDIFCASQASTAICLSMDQASCSSSNTIQLGGRVIDRHNPIINDSRRKSTSKTLIAPCSSSSQPPIEPKKKISSSTSKLNNGTKVCEEKKKSEAEKVAEHVTIKRRLVKPLGDSITPFGSTRSLLSHTPIFDGSSHYHQIVGQHESNPASKLSRSSCPISGSSDQVSFFCFSPSLSQAQTLNTTLILIRRHW